MTKFTPEQYKEAEAFLHGILETDWPELMDICEVEIKGVVQDDIWAFHYGVTDYPRGGIWYVERSDVKHILEPKPHTPTEHVELTPQEMFDLGNAYGSFSCGDVDQGIHLVLPVVDNSDEGVWSNKVFEGLFWHINKIPENANGQLYMNAIRVWARDNGLDIGLEQ